MEKTPEVMQLSKDLRALKIHSNIPDPVAFRSINSVSLKLANLKRLDNNFSGVGMKAGSEMEKAVWAEFYQYRDSLNKEADFIRAHYLKPDSVQEPATSNIDERAFAYQSDFPYLVHKNKETDPIATRLKKEIVLKESRHLKCEVCELDFTAFYGRIGLEAAELHYISAIDTSPAHELSSVSDYAIVCSSCHKILDKNYELITVQDLKKIIKKK